MHAVMHSLLVTEVANMTHTYNTKAFYELILTPSEYAKLSEDDRENIKSVQIIPPKLGDNHFGKIKIVRKHPVFAVTP